MYGVINCPATQQEVRGDVRFTNPHNGLPDNLVDLFDFAMSKNGKGSSYENFGFWTSH